MDLRPADLAEPAVQALVGLHLAAMQANSPADFVFALDASGLQHVDVSVWSAWDDDVLLGIGALRTLDADSGELKSMRTHPAHVRKGVARAILEHLIEAARAAVDDAYEPAGDAKRIKAEKRLLEKAFSGAKRGLLVAAVQRYVLVAQPGDVARSARGAELTALRAALLVSGSFAAMKAVADPDVDDAGWRDMAGFALGTDLQALRVATGTLPT